MRYEEGIADCDQAIKLDPRLASAYDNRGLAKFGLGRNEEAIADFDQAIKLDPSAISYSNRGVVKHMIGRSSEAKEDLVKASILARYEGDEYLITRIEEYLKQFY